MSLYEKEIAILEAKVERLKREACNGHMACECRACAAERELAKLKSSTAFETFQRLRSENERLRVIPPCCMCGNVSSHGDICDDCMTLHNKLKAEVARLTRERDAIAQNCQSAYNYIAELEDTIAALRGDGGEG